MKEGRSVVTTLIIVKRCLEEEQKEYGKKEPSLSQNFN